MILPTIESFEYVTGDLDKIKLDVDVMPNRTGREKNVAYGKDIATIMEHSGMCRSLLTGFDIRTRRQYEPVPKSTTDPRDVPAVFSRLIKSTPTKYYLSHNHKTETFRKTGTTVYNGLTMKYCAGFPTFDPDCEFTDHVVEELTDYEGINMFVGERLKLSELEKWMRDTKKQHYPYVELGVYGSAYQESDDTWITYDAHGSYAILQDYYYYQACPRGDNWRILGNSTVPFEFHYPTLHIKRAELWMYQQRLFVTREWRDDSGTIHDEDYWLGPFVYRVSASENGTLVIDQDRIIQAMKTAVERSGHTFYTMNDVGHGYSNRDTFNFRLSPNAVVIFQLDDHTKWWE